MRIHCSRAFAPVGGNRENSSRWTIVTPIRRSTGSRRKRLGSRRCINRAHWPAAQSSERSCGSSCKDSRARGSRCPALVCAGVRTGDEFQRFPPTPACTKRREIRPALHPGGSRALSRTMASKCRNGARSSAERRTTNPERYSKRPRVTGRGRRRSPGMRSRKVSDSQAR